MRDSSMVRLTMRSKVVHWFHPLSIDDVTVEKEEEGKHQIMIDWMKGNCTSQCCTHTHTLLEKLFYDDVMWVTMYPRIGIIM
jgi:hypothetical protein